MNDVILNQWDSLSRRRFLGVGGSAVFAAYALGVPHVRYAAAQPGLGGSRELDATSPEGIDLFIERRMIPIAGEPSDAITINGGVPGPLIRMREGRDARIRVHNRLDEATSIHWHGVLLPFTMDGVPGISFEGIAPGTTFEYRYPVRQNGTYWYHSHSGLQEQLGHYGQLVIEPADTDPVRYDVEHSIVLSDWTHMDPHVVMHKLKTMEGYFNYQRPTLANLEAQAAATGQSIADVIKTRLSWQRMRMDPTDIADVTGATYSFLMNGRTPDENWTAIAQPGQRVRLRIVNASALTYYDFRVDGLPMMVVQADGQNIEPVETDELRIAVAETYDVVVTLPDDHPRTLFAEAMDRSGFARGTIAPRPGLQAAIPERRQRPMLTMADMGMMHAVMKKESIGAGSMDHGGHEIASGMPDASVEQTRPAGEKGLLPISGLPEQIEHGPDTHGPGSIVMGSTRYRQLSDPGSGLGDDGRRVLTYSQLRCLETPADRRPPTRQFDLHLTGNMHKYIWGFDGKKWSEADMIRFQFGERLRINMINDTMMNHPIHLHGMWMDLYAGENYAKNPRKHTVNVQPAELLTVDITADAPGQWAFHCHVLYHMKVGMFRTVAVVRSLDEEVTHAGS